MLQSDPVVIKVSNAPEPVESKDEDAAEEVESSEGNGGARGR